MRALIAFLLSSVVVGFSAALLGIAGCGVDSKGIGGTQADAATDPCAGMLVPAAACAVGPTVTVCELVGGRYRLTVTCPGQAADGGSDVGDAGAGTGDSGTGTGDGGTGTGDAVATDVAVAGDARADVATGDAGAGAGDAGTPCATMSQCGSGEVCTTVDGVCNKPPGCSTGGGCTTVCYGTCRPADVGVACGNTICAVGMTCCNPSCSTCVAPGGGCTKQLCVSPACEKDSDCQPVADYCTGCDCRSLAKGESLPGCSGPGVRCLVDPCLNKVGACVNKQCALGAKS